jgi:hypothetical protein
MADDRNSPATKGDLADLRTEFKGGLSDLRTDLKRELADQKDGLIEAIRDSQTEVLKAFYGFSQTIQDRFKESDDSEAAIKRRMTTLESRILEVEKRLNMPPNAA